ncbi:hypothetical protein [Chelativorans salis]|uniref:Uncharacterized protein n=1 Tax=Chelativorans salis TaxID=2978478 RepID=A0ABT2LK27_9HYPH|nr:hypothetical protein [Chelativorans sp. EGI FJ00035]MCT7374187.1 hypothetical protein [Chelativorans sp. EGI FJ00035]
MLLARKLTSTLLGVSLTAALVAAPYRFTYTGPSKGLLPQMAVAQDESEGSDSGSGGGSQSSDESEDEGTISPSGAREADEQSGSVPTDAGEAGQASPAEEVEHDISTEPADNNNVDQVEPDQAEPDQVGPDQVEPDQQEPADEATVDVPTEAEEPIEEANVEVQYSNGMREEIRGGRYEMTDAQGRVIINRPATESDHTRLLRAMGR